MGLRAIAEIDLGKVLEDDTTGFGYPITVTDPAGTSVALKGFSNDIGQVIDPDTGQPVSGRAASVAIRIGLLTGAGLGIPSGVVNTVGKPWVIVFDDINGNSFTFKVSESIPDRSIGVVVCMLELYKAV